MAAGQARRSAGAVGAGGDERPEAKRAASRRFAFIGRRPRLWSTSAAAVAAAVCAGLVLSGAAPFGHGATAVPAAATGTMTRDGQTLSRAYVDREAASVTPDATDASDEPTATADASAAPAVFYLLSAANLRTTASTTGTVVATLPAGTQVTATGDAAGGWQPVASGSTTGFIKSSLLTTTAPATSKRPASTTGAASSSYPACASGSAVEAGLVANAILVHRAVCATFPDITTYGGVRGDGSEHATGHALDIMTSGSRGQQIAAWLQANYSKLGIVEIIYQQQIWTTQRASEGWRPMPDRGSVTANHYDHIHVLVA